MHSRVLSVAAAFRLASLSAPASLAAALGGLNRRLAMRAALTGHSLGLADGAMWLALKRVRPPMESNPHTTHT